MLIAFYVQGILNFSVGIVHYILLPVFPAHEPLRKWTGVLLLDLVNNWVAVGIALIIAAFSQWKTISIFHLYICSNLAFTIPIFNPTAVGVIDPHSNRSMLQVAYFILYGMLRLALSAYLIYRFRYWENTSGRCFAVSHAGPVHIGMETRTKLIALTACYIALDLSLATLGLIRQIRRGRAVLDFTKGLVHPAWTQKKYTAVMRGGLYLGLFTGNIISTITLVHANRGHVLGDEYMFTFGQVGALVVLAGSFYAMVNSFLRK